MAKLLQVRGVPDHLHRLLKARAALSGMSLSEYVLKQLVRSAERPTREELRQRLAGRSTVEPSVPPAVAVAAERERR